MLKNDLCLHIQQPWYKKGFSSIKLLSLCTPAEGSAPSLAVVRRVGGELKKRREKAKERDGDETFSQKLTERERERLKFFE